MASLGQIKSVLQKTLSLVFAEASITQQATWNLLASRAHDGTKKRTVLAYTDSTVTILNVRKSHNVVPSTPVATDFQVTGVDYLIMASSLPAGASTRDKITIDGFQYSILEMRPYLGVAYGLVLEYS